LWEYLCTQWNQEHGVGLLGSGNDTNGGGAGSRLLRFNFFMLQADVLPNMGFSATRKRLIHSHECTYREGGNIREDVLDSVMEEEGEEVRDEEL